MIRDFEKILDKHWNEIINVRKQIHRNPELTYKEYETSKLIKSILDKHEISYKDNICDTGILGLLEGSDPGKTVAIRCDMDALPILEKTGVEFSSQNEGIMHACGHDAHIAMVLGAALVLNNLKSNISGNIKFIFQPGEEDGIVGGAKQMIEAGVLENPRVDCIFGIHVWPEGEGRFGVSRGEMMASCDIWKLKIIGKSGHISTPHKAKNPIFVAAQIINSISGLRTQNIDPFEKVIFDIGSMHAGTSVGNIIPDEVFFVGNTRLYNNSLRRKVKDDFVNLLEGFSRAYGIDYELDYQFGYAPVINDNLSAEFFRKSALKVLGKEEVTQPEPVMGSEDFGEYLRLVPGAFGWLKVKQDKYTPLHNSSFLVDEDTIRKGILIYCQTILDYLNQY